MGAKISALIEEEAQAIESKVAMETARKHQCQTVMNGHCLTNLMNCCTGPSTLKDTHMSTPEYMVERSSKAKRSLYQNTTDDNKENSSTNLIPRKRKISPDVESNASLSICRVKRAPGKGSFLAAFLKVFDDDIIQDFLWMDSCYRLSDKYLLAMVYAYFRRANLMRREYTRTNFFAALYLAHDMEEDDEDLKIEIFPWVLGARWRENHTLFLVHRDSLLKRIEYRAAVSKLTCDEIISLCPAHPIWKRERKPHHGGAKRLYPDDEDMDFSPRGPSGSPVFCALCAHYEASEIRKNSAELSPAFTSGYLSASSSDLQSPTDSKGVVEPVKKASASRKRADSILENLVSSNSSEAEEVLMCREE